MELTKVIHCNGKSCAFNDRNKCHAMMVEVGDPEGPFCDTFVRSSIKCACDSPPGQISTCKVRVCRHNENMECSAGQVQIELKSDAPQCHTFTPR